MCNYCHTLYTGQLLYGHVLLYCEAMYQCLTVVKWYVIAKNALQTVLTTMHVANLQLQQTEYAQGIRMAGCTHVCGWVLYHALYVRNGMSNLHFPCFQWSF